MHELGMCASIVDAIERRAGSRPVARVRVRVGRLHHVHPEAFDQSFAMAAAGSVAEDGQAEVVILPIRRRCHSCGADFESDDVYVDACPTCGGVDVETTGGDELVLELIEYRA